MLRRKGSAAQFTHMGNVPRLANKPSQSREWRAARMGGMRGHLSPIPVQRAAFVAQAADSS